MAATVLIGLLVAVVVAAVGIAGATGEIYTAVSHADLATAVPGLDRLLVPGADAARQAVVAGLSVPEGLALVYLHRQPGFAFDAALGDIARTEDVATARWVAKTLQYPATNPQLSGPAWPWALTLRPILLAAAAVTAAWGIRVLRRRRRVPHRGVEGSARGTGWPRQRKQRIARPTSSHPSS